MKGAKQTRLPILTARRAGPQGTESTLVPNSMEKSEFSTAKDLIDATEKGLLKLNLARGHDLLDSEFKQCLSSLRKQSHKSIMGSRNFKVKKEEIEHNSLASTSQNFSHIMLKVRKKSTPVLNSMKTEEVSSKVMDRDVISFYNSVKDPDLLKAADPNLEKVIEGAISRNDYLTFSSNLGELVRVVHKVLDTIESSQNQLEPTHFQILVDICRRKFYFIENCYSKLANTSKGSFPSKPVVDADPEASTDNTGFGSSLTTDVKYLMSALRSQREYYQAKMQIFKWKDEDNLDQVADLYNQYVDHKTMLQVKSQKLEFSTYVEAVQEMMEGWIKVVTEGDRLNKKQEFEISALKTQIEDMRATIDRERKNISEIQNQMKNQKGVDEASIMRRFDDNFKLVTNNQKAEVQKANEDRDIYKNENIRLQELVGRYEMEKLKRESNKQTKETQAVFQIGAAKEAKRLFTDVINSPEKIAISKGDSSSKSWLCGMLNYLIVARFNFELEKDHNNIEPKSMKNFIIETLLVKFGSAQAAEHILRDLIASIKRFSTEGERFKLFARFLGIEDILSNDIVKKRKANKYEDFLTNYYYTSHLAIRDYLEFALLAKGFEFNKDNSLKPLLGFCTNKRTKNLMLPIDIAKNIFILYILSREHKSQLQPELLQDEFENILKEDLYERLHEKGKEIKSINFKNEEFYISYDYLVKVLLERRLNFFIDYIQKFLSALTIHSASHGEKNLFYDDLSYSCREILPNLSDSLIGHIYREISDSPQLQSYSLEKMVQSAVHTVVLLNFSQENLDLSRLALTKESSDERLQMVSAAEHTMNTRLRMNTVKKEGSRFQALIDGLSQWREKHLLGRGTEVMDSDEAYRTLLKWRLDNITSLVCLQECYRKAADRISLAEKSNESIAILNTQLRDFFSGMSGQLITKENFEELKEIDTTELSAKIEKMWKILRKIISESFYHNLMD
jgi:hypothetical protein